MPEETEAEEEKPLWARLSFWIFIGAFFASLGGAWQYRADVLRLAREGIAAYAGPAEEARDGGGPALDLSAPVDPSRNFSKVSPGARVKTSARGRRMMRDVKGRGRSSAAEVAEVRQYMNAPEVGGEAEYGFWRTDLGIGILISGGISFCFFVAGSILFRNRDSHGKKVT